MSNRNLSKKVGSAVAMLMAAATASAQFPVQIKNAVLPQPKDVVVTARPNPTEREIERQGIAITRGGELARDPLARFADPVCPGITGLPITIASLMVDRIRYDADRVGATLDPRPKCAANILVIFVRDGAAEVRKLLKNNGFLLAGLATEEGNDVAHETGPVRAWNLTKLRTRYDEVESQALQQGPVTLKGPSTLGTVRVDMVPSSDSHIYLASQIDIVQSVVVINVGAIDGMSLNQIADYAAMRALAKTRPAPGASPAATILSLFAPSSRRPSEMTSFDLAYLRSLYDAGSNVPALVKIGGIMGEFRKEEAQVIKTSAP